MSVTQICHLAHKARAKLSREIVQPDQDLRLLLGHTVLLDTLMVKLTEAESEQGRWINQSVRNTPSTKSSGNRHVRWADRTVEESSGSDSDSSSDYEDEDAKVTRTMSNITVKQVEEEEEDGDLQEDYAQFIPACISTTSKPAVSQRAGNSALPLPACRHTAFWLGNISSACH